MTDPVSLAAAAVAVVSPYLVAGATEAAKSLGKETATGTLKVIGWLRSKLTGAGAEALAEAEQAPQDAGAQAALRLQVRKLLEGNAALASELEALLAAVPRATKQQTLTQTGNENRAAVVDGTGDTVTVS